MKVLAFDGRAGAAGDMILGALLAAGADPAALEPIEDALPVAYDVGEATRGGIAGTDVTVRVADGHDQRDSDHGHTHGDRDHDDGGHDHAHGEAHAGAPAEGHGHTRTYPEVVEVVESMAIPDAVREDALRAFEVLGEAEAAVHGTDLAETAFHEVGADDAIADVVGAMALLDDLDPDQILTTPVAAGGGEVSTSHGTYPVPPPAVVEIAERADWELRGGPVETELLTPTGAAILAAVADGVERLPTVRVEDSGYGTGTKELASRPNVLRAIVGTARGDLDREGVAVLETNLDDASPELLGSLQETLPDAGALDVSVVPTTMKKSRPGHLVKVIAAPEDAERVARRLAAETGTLGVREGIADHRYVLDRTIETATVTVDGVDHEVALKVATDGDEVVDVSAEHDDALAVARETGLAVRDVMRRAEAAFRSDR